MSGAQNYRYVAYTDRGKLVEGRLQASSHAEATDALWKRGLTPLETVADSGLDLFRWPSRDSLLRRNPTRREVAFFTRELATLSQAGIPVDDTLRIMNERPETGRMKAIAAALLDDVLDGAHISDAMARSPHVFPGDYVNMVRAGEASGELDRVFGELAELLEHRQEIADRFTSALIYPCVLMIVAAVSIGVVMGVLIPALAPLFSDSGRPMPAVIALVIRIGEIWPLLLAGAVATLVALFAAAGAISRSPALRLTADRVLLQLPIVGAVSNGVDVARFARTLGLLLRAGVSMLTALNSARTVIRNSYVAAGLTAATEAVRDGQSLARAVTGQPGISPVCIRMIAVGEETGKLDQMLVRIAVMLEQQSRRRIERLMTILSPAMTIGVAGLVGVLIFTVMNAVLSVNELVVR